MKTIATYTLQIQVDHADTNGHVDPGQREKRVLADLPSVIEETEENLTDLLPAGVSVQIREWDEEHP